jgi:hypothetical protein
VKAIGEVLKMNERLAFAGVAREEIALQLLFIDTTDLLRNGDGVAVFIIDARDAQMTARIFPRSCSITRSVANLDFGYSQAGVRRPSLVDRLVVFGGLHDQKCACEHELFDLKTLQAAQEPSGPLNSQVPIQGAGLA